MVRSWVLIGMMGSGKSTVGRLLAETSGREFLDTDQAIQYKMGRSISQIFSVYGESTFRDHETLALKSLMPGNSVIATGGGVVLRQENWTEMHRLGLIIYLKSSKENLISRLEASKRKRPLLETEDWKLNFADILEKRHLLYESADITVTVDGLEMPEIVNLILQNVGTHHEC